jgi:hypothetical protein
MADYCDILQDALEDEGYQRLYEEMGPQWSGRLRKTSLGLYCRISPEWGSHARFRFPGD